MKRPRLGRARRLTAGHVNHEHPAWSPDGRLIAFAAGPPGAVDLYLVDRRGRFARRLTDGPGDKSQPAFSPDGSRVAFRLSRDPSAPSEVFELHLHDEGPARRLLAAEGASFHHPAYSPDGRRLAYLSDEGSPGNLHVFVLDRETSARRRLTDDPARNDGHPAFSPDGRRIAFHAYQGLEAERSSIHLLDLASGEVSLVVEGPGYAKHPAFVGERRIIFHRDIPGEPHRICLADVGTGCEARLTGPDASAKHPAVWVTPRGRAHVACAARPSGADDPLAPRWFDIRVAVVKGLRA